MLCFVLTWNLDKSKNLQMKLRLWISLCVVFCQVLAFAIDSVVELEAKVSHQDSDAAFKLGSKYYFGDGVEKDYQRAKQLFENSKKWGKDPFLANTYIELIENKSDDGKSRVPESTVDKQGFNNSNTSPEYKRTTGESDQDKRNREAIEAVADQFNKASIAFTNSVNAIKKNPIKAGLSSAISDTIVKYHDDLVAIDISDCPADFRIAFVKYYQAVHELKKYADSITGFRGVLKGVVNGVGAIVNLHDNTDKAVDPLEKAGNELTLVCTKYGIKIEN